MFKHCQHLGTAQIKATIFETETIPQPSYTAYTYCQKSSRAGRSKLLGYEDRIPAASNLNNSNMRKHSSAEGSIRCITGGRRFHVAEPIIKDTLTRHASKQSS